MRRYVGDHCVYQPEPILVTGEWGYIRKRISWATNCPEIGKRFSKRCPGNHLHVKTEDGVIKQAEIYSKRLLASILGGLSKTSRSARKPLTVLEPEKPLSTRGRFRVQEECLAYYGGAGPNKTEEELERQYAEYFKQEWKNYTSIPRFYLHFAFKKPAELTGLRATAEEDVQTDEEDAGLPRTHPNGNHFPLRRTKT